MLERFGAKCVKVTGNIAQKTLIERCQSWRRLWDKGLEGLLTEAHGSKRRLVAGLGAHLRTCGCDTSGLTILVLIPQSKRKK